MRDYPKARERLFPQQFEQKRCAQRSELRCKNWTQMMSICKLLKRLVPREGFEPSRDYSQRILSLLRGYSHQLTTRYQAVFTDVSAVKASYVWFGIGT